MGRIHLIQHNYRAPLLRLLGLGPKFIPTKAIEQLQTLLNENTFWAKNRSKKEIKKMIAHSNSIVTMWEYQKMIGFGRATSDNTFRCVLWDIVIAEGYQNLGLGKTLIESLVNSKSIQGVEKVYLMTTNCKEFYKGCGFVEVTNQSLLVRSNNM